MEPHFCVAEIVERFSVNCFLAVLGTFSLLQNPPSRPKGLLLRVISLPPLAFSAQQYPRSPLNILRMWDDLASGGDPRKLSLAQHQRKSSGRTIWTTRCCASLFARLRACE
jgi:hypothetical protein